MYKVYQTRNLNYNLLHEVIWSGSANVIHTAGGEAIPPERWKGILLEADTGVFQWV